MLIIYMFINLLNPTIKAVPRRRDVTKRSSLIGGNSFGLPEGSTRTHMIPVRGSAPASARARTRARGGSL